MAFTGPSGLPGAPEEGAELYELLGIEGHEDLKCWLHRDVCEWMTETPRTHDGDHLFFVDGSGYFRFRLVDSGVSDGA